MTYTLFALIQNKPGVLARMTDIISRRGVNIDSMTMGTAEMSGLSRLTMTAHGEEAQVNEMIGQLQGLSDVVSLQNFSEEQMSYYVASQINESYM